MVNLSSGEAAAMTCSGLIPTWDATAAALSALSPVTNQLSIPRTCSSEMVWAASALMESDAAKVAMATPSHARTAMARERA